MIKTGINRLEQLTTAKLQDLFGRDRNVSILLYFKVDKVLDLHKRENYAEIILNRFNSKNNVIKRTYRNRFNKFDDYIIEILKNQNFPQIFLHELAISDGRASIYFLNKVLNSFNNAEYHASDIAIIYYLFNINSNCYVICNNNGQIIEITMPPFVWNYERREGGFYFLNNFLKQLVKNKYQKLINDGDLKKSAELILVDKELLDIKSATDRVHLFNHDLFDMSEQKYNVIRAMNILHYGYFNDSQIKIILFRIYNSLLDDGLFIEGSNENAGSEVEGAIYKKSATGFKIIASAERQSKIFDAVARFNIHQDKNE